MNLQDNSPPVMASDSAPPSPGLLGEDMLRLAHEVRGLVHDHLELAVLETRLTVNTALRMAIVAIVAAIALVSAWLALAGSAVLGLIAIGLTPVVAMLLLAGVNLLLAIFGWRHIRNQSFALGWPATQRLIKPSPAPKPVEPVT